MPALAFGLLAHADTDCVAELLESLALYAPGGRVLLFNGGHDRTLGGRLDIETCRYSRPVRWARGLHHFVPGIIRQMHEDDWEYDYLVTLDSDMLLIRDGLPEKLEALMDDFDYMAAFYRVAPRGSGWLWSERMYKQWRQWGPLLGPEPLRMCYNPGQVLSREFCRRLMSWTKLPQLYHELERSKLQVLEELVWPSLVNTLGMKARPWPDLEASALHGLHTPVRIRDLVAGGASLLHKVKMELSAPERAYARAMRRGEPADAEALTAGCGPEYDRRDPPTAFRRRMTLGARAKDAYLAGQSLWWAHKRSERHTIDATHTTTSRRAISS